MSLFKPGSFSDEIFEAMEQNLTKIAAQSANSRSEKLSRAAGHLSHAIEIFKDAGMEFEAQQLTKIALEIK